jgi:hypothetical protein
MQYTDPPGMPEDERMTPAEFKVVREFLGLTGDWLAQHLGVSSRTVRHWEYGKYAIPDGVRLEMEDLEARTGTYVGSLVEQLMDLPDPGVITYRDDAEYGASHPDHEFPASWHRAVVARVAQEVPGLSIVYPDQAAKEGQASGEAARRSG